MGTGIPSLIRSFDTEESKSLEIPEIAKLKPGKFKLELKTEDAFGNEILDVKFFTLNQEDAKTPAVSSVLTASPHASTAEPGESVELLLGTTERHVPLIFQVVRDHEVIDQLHLDLRRGQETISIPVEENWRGNVSLQMAFVLHNEMHIRQQNLVVPWSNKELKLEWMTFRSELQPGQFDQWKLKISGPKAEQVNAEMVAALYDASLDQFRSNDFALSLYPTRYNRLRWNGTGYGTKGQHLVERNWNRSMGRQYQNYDALNWFNYAFGAGYGMYLEDVVVAGAAPGVRPRRSRAPRMMSKSAAMPAAPAEAAAEADMDGMATNFNSAGGIEDKEGDDFGVFAGAPEPEPQEENPSLDAVQVRTNLNELPSSIRS